MDEWEDESYDAHQPGRCLPWLRSCCTFPAEFDITERLGTAFSLKGTW